MTTQQPLSRHNPAPSPPSCPKPRQRRKKSTDPFLNLSSTPAHSHIPPASPHSQAPEQQESPLTRILVSPLLMTSFVLSLFLVNRRDRQRRAAAHPSPSSASASLASYFSPRAWLDPEPYQDPASTAWRRRADARADEKGWFLTKKHRAMTRLEVGDALEMRGSVIKGMVAAAVVLVVGAVVADRKSVV